MKSVEIRLYEELNDHLPPERRKRVLVCRFEGSVMVRALLKAIGVPIEEVDLILCNGESVPPEAVVHNGDRISVYPVFEALDLSGTTRVRNAPLRRPRFAVAPGMTSLAHYLRMLGFDTIMTQTGVSARQGRIDLSMQDIPADATHAMKILERTPRRQAAEVVKRLDLGTLIVPFGRCPRCNRTTVATGSGRRCPVCRRNGLS